MFATKYPRGFCGKIKVKVLSFSRGLSNGRLLCYNMLMLKLYLCKTYSEVLKRAGECAAAFGKDPSRKLFAFCEDKLTMSLEREVATACGGGSFNVQVTSFSRFIHRFSREKGLVLDKETSAMAVRNILIESCDDLACFKRSAYNPSTAITLYELIAQLKSANVTPQDLAESAEELGGALGGKIKDIIYVYNAYEKFIGERGVYDSNSYLALMPEILKNNDFKAHSAMAVGFSSLTKQGIEIMRAIAENMQDLTVFTIAGENKELYTNELKDALMREIGDFCIIDSVENYSAEREAVMKYLYEPTCVSAPKTETDKIFLYDAVDYVDEMDHVAKIIRREVIGGMRYRDIAVAVGAPDSYKNVISAVFGDYDIPYFIDSRKALASHPLPQLALIYMDAIKYRLRPCDAIALEKDPYFQPDRDVADRFENFTLRNALTSKSLKSGLNQTLIEQNKYGDAAECELFETERALVVGFYGGAKSRSQIAAKVVPRLDY